MLDRLLLVACILIVVALILYFFYWNRFLGCVLGLALRVLYWNQEGFSCWIEIGSIHFSILTGRVLLKDVHYHSSNQTIKIVKGQIQWRYWIRQPMTEDELYVKGEEHQLDFRVLSCRIQITVQGFEWFLYNRTAAYDNIIAQMEESLNRNISRSTDRNRSSQKLNRFDSMPSRGPSRLRRTLRVPATIQHAFTWFKEQLPVLDPKELLPLGIQVSKGAIICGNSSTSSLLVAEFSVCQGTFGITQARSRCDLYKQVLALKFHNAVIQMAENERYVDPMSTLGEVIHDRVDQYPTLKNASSYISYNSFWRLWRQLSLYPLTLKYGVNRQRQRNFRASAPPRRRSKRGKGVEEETPVGADFSTLEYAIERKILETPTLEMSYLVDIVGDVPPVELQEHPGTYEFGNGDVSPDWVLELIVHGGIVRYGPWADRQRAELQKVFFPPTYQTVEQTRPVGPGDKRIWTALQIFVELRNETTLHVPFREASKDWQWDGLVEVPKRSRRREPVSINVMVGDRSSIHYSVPMVADSSGYEGVFEVHLDDISVTSSLNDIRLVAAESCRVHGDLPSPLKWNDERTWAFDVTLRQPILYLLRDHINMFTDLGKDWASGPPSDWQRWVPTIYAVNFNLYHYKIHLYANDQNIIDKPLVCEDNALVILLGDKFETNVIIPSNKFRPESTTVQIAVRAPDLSIDFSLPRWNTRAAYISKDGCNLARAGSFALKASYHYYSDTREDFVDHLTLDFKISKLVYQALGWSIRYWMVLRDNYLGSFTNFSTLYEYIDKRRKNIPVGDPVDLKYRRGKSNMFQCTLSVVVDGGVIALPASVFGIEARQPPDLSARFRPCIVLSFSELQLHLRLHDYFLEISYNAPTIYGHINHDFSNRLPYEHAKTGQKVMLIDGLDIIANRMFGPMPRTSTYLCIWEMRFGHVKFDMSLLDAQILAHTARSFGLGFTDLTNAPAAEYMPVIDPDITFYKVQVKSFEMVMRANDSALQILCDSGIKIDSNDVGGMNYSKSTGLQIPHIVVKVLLRASAERNAWLEAAHVATDLYVDMYAAPKGFREHIEKQRAFVSEQDKLTDRAARLLSRTEGGRSTHKNGVYIPQPRLPRSRKPKARIVHPQPRRAIPAVYLHRSSAVVDVSESEEEGLISEADRDARLARTRTSTPMTPIHFRDEERPMSSGDESDDADLTDGDSTDSDWTDLEGRVLNRDESLLKYYAHLTRHYAGARRNDPGYWENPSFVLTKDRGRFFASRLSNHYTTDVQRALQQSPVTVTPDPEQGSFTTRLYLKRSLEFKLTPLLVPVFGHFQQAISSIRLGPELEVDALIAECNSFISSSAKEEVKGANRKILEASCPGITIHVLQNLSMSEEGHPRIAPQLKESHISSRLDIAMEVGLCMERVTFKGVFSERETRMKSSIQSISLQLDTLSDKHVPSPSTESTILDCRVTGLEVDSQPSRVHLCWADFTTTVGHRGPELLTAAAITLKQGLSQSLEAVRTVEKQKRAVIQNMTYGILRLSENLTVIDPLSTIQPSYLVQEGIPHRLRTDPTFRFLLHLRNCLRNLTPGERDRILTSQMDPNPPNPGNFEAVLHARFLNLAQDLDSTHSSTLLEKLLKIKKPKDHPMLSTSRGISSISVELQKTRLRILAPTGPSYNEFITVGVRVNARMRPLDLIQHSFNHPASMSQTSLRDKRPHLVKRISVQVTVDAVYFTIYSHLMNFVQQILRVRRIYLSQLVSTSIKPKVLDDKQLLSNNANGSWYIDATILLESVRLQAAAANLIFEIGAKAVRSVSSLSLPSGQGDKSLGTSIIFNKIYLQARSPLDKAKPGTDQDVLAAVELTMGKVNTVMRQEQNLRRNVKVTFSLDGLHLSVPRSALKLYRFVEEWRADFLPGMEVTFKAALSELRIPSDKAQSPTPSVRSSPGQPLLQVNGQVIQTGISLQVMHGTWLSWQANHVITYLRSSSTPFGPSSLAFGLQITSTTLEVSTKQSVQDTAPNIRVKLAFPSLSLGGSYDGRVVQAHVIIDFLDLKVKPSHWDTLLAVQRKFGQDFDDFVALMQETRRRSSLKTPKPQQPSRLKSALKFGGFLKMRGFRIGFEGFSSTMFLECQDIGGGLRGDSGSTWDIGLTDLALSLAPRATGSMTESFNRGRRSVFVIIDAKLVAGKQNRFPYGQTLELVITKIHAVMQPSSIGEIGDFVDHLQAEISERKEQRAQELAAFKQKTQSIMRTFEVKVRDVQTEQAPWLAKYLISVTIKDLGIAFPITLEQDIQLLRQKYKSAFTKAFLFSISSIAFAINRGETGEAVMKDLSFQFVSRFRQSEPSDFNGAKHITRNRLVYPEMKAQLRSVLRADSRQLWVTADVSGFILDLDSTIANYVFSLIDVYRQGKERLERLSTNAARSPPSIPEALEKPALERHYHAIPTSNVFASFTFQSGKVRMYSDSALKLYRNRSLSTGVTELADEHILEIGAEIFNLPVVSVWAEYRATPALQKLGGSRDQEPSTLMFKSTVHSSRNILRPTLLPFFTELVNHIETRMRKDSFRMIQSPLLSQSSSTASVDKEDEEDALKAVSSMRVSFSLRIDRSMLEFTCQPDVNVVACLHWESGGFIVNVSPGARQVTFTGTVGGLSIGLKHGFLSEDCLHLDARNLTFSVSFSKLGSGPRHTINSISIALDTEFHGRVKFSRLQDILCFKAVWLDLFPLINNQPTSETRPTKYIPNASLTAPPQVKQVFSTLLLLRVRQINLELDLSQSISKINLNLNQAVLRTKLTEKSSEVGIYVGELLIVADGNLSGRVRVQDCLFQTIRRIDTQLLKQVDGRMLELRLTSGPLIATLESDRQRLLHYHAEPLEVEIYDDWTSTSSTGDQEKPLHLSFIVTSPEIVAAVTIGTIPKLMSYANKFTANLEAQREGASRESAAFRGSRSSKPDNPLSAVAEAMLQTAKTKFKEADNNLSHVIRQFMSLRLDHLRLIVFPRSMEDPEIAQFVARNVQAQLNRFVATESAPAQRDLHLSFSSMVISKYTQHQISNISPPEVEDCRSWLEAFVKGASEATIVGLPSMKMHMVSEELDGDTTKTLLYDFHSNFIRRGLKEVDDIYITLNVALYSWLTLLRKNMTREMDQVQATAEWRTSLTTGLGSPTIAERRRKAPDPLSPTDSPIKSTTLPPTSAPSPPLLPTTQARSTTTLLPSTTPKAAEQAPTISQLATRAPFPVPDSSPSDMNRLAKRKDVRYEPRKRSIERLTMRQLGEATPDVMHPFFMKKAGFNLEDSLPQYVNEYATAPLEEIMEVLLKLYSRQLKSDQ
ncbi:hypothetical protein P691DRAFT_468038 [Macrolepiota fuliginosa MF-IS2]|uniref:Csf1 N-terminal domain-containing protein n=1 Tax=Macrolepiota fuliginosa MF-IS2 TaxID=1400762 RepID=A0A9P6C6K4_9AGAR|nr:hypothetical protein P691DRAFT_468038 [Macrolepiota fuliginosa MF-IS2]